MSKIATLSMTCKLVCCLKWSFQLKKSTLTLPCEYVNQMLSTFLWVWTLSDILGFWFLLVLFIVPVKMIGWYSIRWTERSSLMLFSFGPSVLSDKIDVSKWVLTKGLGAVKVNFPKNSMKLWGTRLYIHALVGTLLIHLSVY